MIWKKIPGYSKYEISIMGDIKRNFTSSSWMLKPTKKQSGPYVIRLIADDGKRKEERVHKLMQKTYMDKPPSAEYVVYHKNGDKKDNCLNNLAYITRQKLGKMTGPNSSRKPVRKVCPETKEIIDFYTSVREAGRKNHMSYQTVSDSCHKVNKKSSMAPDGYIYEFDR